MSEQLKLGRLLPRRQIESWLNTITSNNEQLKVGIVEPDGRLFARSGPWQAEHLTELAGSDLSNPMFGDQIYQKPLIFKELLLGTFFAGGQGEIEVQFISDVVCQALLMLINQASENRGLAVETLDRYRELNLLYRIGETIGTAVEPSKISSMILEEGGQIIDADFGLVLLKDEQSSWEIVAGFGIQFSEAEISELITKLVDESLSNNRPAIVADFPKLNLAGTGFLVHSLLWAPLSTSEKILGGVLMGRSVDRPLFIANDQKLLVALASQAAIALDKAYLFEEAKAAAHYLKELNTIGRELAGMLDLDAILQRILQAAIDLTKSIDGAFFLVEQPSNDLVFKVVEGGQDDLLGVRLPTGTGIAGQAASTGQPQIVNDTQENKYWFDGIDKLRDSTTRSVLAVPLLKQDEVIGVLEVINRKDGKPFSQQDIDKLTALSSQAVVAIETSRLHQSELTKQRMERELQLGHTMQSSLIPTSVPDLSGWEFAAWWEPAREVSGDFYDFIQISDELGVVMADVADKGVQAALFMTLTRSTVRTCLDALRSPAIGISAANRLISQDASGGMFVTLTYAHFGPDSGDITYVNAGHNPPYWYQQDKSQFQELATTGIFLGFDSGIPFEEKTIHCAPGDFVVFFTDGVTEAMNAQRQLFGEERFCEALEQSRNQSPDEMVKSIKRILADYVEDTPQSDDITLVIAKRKGGQI